MHITLRYPFGIYRPGAVVDVDPQIAAVLVRESMAAPTGPAVPAKPAPAPTAADVHALAARQGCSLTEARDLIAAARRGGPQPDPLAQPPEETTCA